MHIFINNKKLYLDNYKAKCAVGKRGIGFKKKEGDLITPRGKFKIKSLFYRNDRVFNLKSKIKKIAIKKDMGWCNDPNSSKYNKLIKFPFKYGAEKLYRSDKVYDIILVLNFNLNPIHKERGSAIFIHVSKKNYADTEGCIALKKKDLRNILKKIDKKTAIEIS